VGRVTSLRAGTSVLAGFGGVWRPIGRTLGSELIVFLVYGIPYSVHYYVDIRVHFVIVVTPIVFDVAHSSVQSIMFVCI